jgi:hypothetical protein
MTQKQFDNYSFSANTVVIYKNKQYPIYSVDFNDGDIEFKVDSQIMSQHYREIEVETDTLPVQTP